MPTLPLTLATLALRFNTGPAGARRYTGRRSTSGTSRQALPCLRAHAKRGREKRRRSARGQCACGWAGLGIKWHSLQQPKLGEREKCARDWESSGKLASSYCTAGSMRRQGAGRRRGGERARAPAAPRAAARHAHKNTDTHKVWTEQREMAGLRERQQETMQREQRNSSTAHNRGV